jgi:hypothetical protein
MLTIGSMTIPGWGCVRRAILAASIVVSKVVVGPHFVSDYDAALTAQGVMNLFVSGVLHERCKQWVPGIADTSLHGRIYGVSPVAIPGNRCGRLLANLLGTTDAAIIPRLLNTPQES